MPCVFVSACQIQLQTQSLCRVQPLMRSGDEVVAHDDLTASGNVPHCSVVTHFFRKILLSTKLRQSLLLEAHDGHKQKNEQREADCATSHTIQQHRIMLKACQRRCEHHPAAGSNSVHTLALHSTRQACNVYVLICMA